MSHDTPTLDAAGLRRFQALSPAVIETVAQRFRTEHDGVYARFGERGVEACREDLAYHVEFLRPVLEFGLTQPLIDYLRWLAGVLATRGVPAHHLPLSLDWLGEAFAAGMDPAYAKIVVSALRNAKAGFLEAGDAEPAIYGRMPQAWPECEAFEARLLAGDRRGAEALLDSRLEQGYGLVDAELHLIQPALYGIGRKWQDNQVSVAQEHLATAISHSLMSRAFLKAELPPPNGKKVLLACVEGNSHAVGLQMVADAFQLAGWEVQLLGANVPTGALVEHVGVWKPDLLGLSVSFAQQLRVVKDIMSRLAKLHGDARPAVIIGGLAINQFDRLVGSVGADAWGHDSRAAVASAASIVKRKASG